MTKIMYEIPSRNDVEEVIITRECVVNKAEPRLIIKAPRLASPEEEIDIVAILPEAN